MSNDGGVLMPPPPDPLVDSQILANTIANTDALTKKLHEQQTQNTKLKEILTRVIKTGRKFERDYTNEKKKSCELEKSLRLIRDQLMACEQREEEQRHELININILHEQSLAQASSCVDVENKENRRIFSHLLHEYLSIVKTLELHNLLDFKGVTKVKNVRRSAEKFPWMKELLREFPCPEKKSPVKKRRSKKAKIHSEEVSFESTSEERDTFEIDGARIEQELLAMSPVSQTLNFSSDSDGSPKKKLVETRNKVLLPKVMMVDAETMTTKITVTRATNTENTKKETVSVGTGFPEINYPSIEEIFKEMIFEMPELIDDLPPTPPPPRPDATTQTDTVPEKDCVSVETITELCNVSKPIGYRKKKITQMSESVKLENFKTEPSSPLAEANSPLYNQFHRVWSSLGEIVYGVLKNSPYELNQAELMLEQEKNLAQLLYREMVLKANDNNNDFVQRYFPLWLNNFAGQEAVPHMSEIAVVDTVEKSTADLPQETPKEPEEIVEKSLSKEELEVSAHQESIIQERSNSSVIIPGKRKSHDDENTWKKIKLQKLHVNEENGFEGFDLDEIREFYAVPPLLDNIKELPEKQEASSFCDKNSSVNNQPEDLLLSIMDFVKGRSARDMTAWQPDTSIVTRCCGIISEYLQAEWITEELMKYVQMIHTPDEQNLFEAVARIVEESKDELIFNPFGSLAPLIPRTHQQILIFCHTLASNYPPGFLRRLMHVIERRMFTLVTNKKSVKCLVNLTYLLIGLMDLQFEERFGKIPIRLFMYKCLYYFHYKAIPLIYMILKAFPDCLPPATDGDYNQSEPILLAIQCSLMNLPPITMQNTDTAEYKKKELLQLLRMKYKYEPGGLSPVAATEILMQRLQSGHTHNVSYALTLIAKRLEVAWTKSTLLQKYLIPTLNGLLLQESSEVRNGQIITLTNTISCIVKSFPNTEDMGEYHRIFGCILDTITECPRVQEAAVAAFIRLSRFGLVNVFSQIYQWRTRTTISRQLAATLDTLAHRKSKKYWLNLEKQIK